MSEAGGGLLLALGLLTPLGAAMVMGTMLVASISVHAPQGLWASDGGYELPLTYGVVAMGLAFTGAGSWSVDHALGVPWTRGWGSGLLAIVLALAVSGVVLARRNTILAQADEPAYPEETTVVSSETEAGARQ